MSAFVAEPRPAEGGLEGNLSVELTADPMEVRLAKEARARLHNTLQVPAIRLLGMAMLSGLVLLHNVYVTERFAFEPWALFTSLSIGYALAAWLTLWHFYPRVRHVDLGLVFLTVDVVWFTGAVWVSGGDHSWLGFLLLIRVADQTNTTVRRVLAFLHFSLLLYLAMLGVQHLLGFPVARPDIELAKIGCLYLMGIYIATTTRTAQQLRRRTAEAMRLARKSINDLKAQGIALEQARTAALEGVRTKTALLANMGHELRTPLAGAIGLTDLALDGPLTKEQREYLVDARGCEKSLLHLIDELLELTNLDTGTDFEAKPFAVRPLLDALVREARPAATAKGLEVVAEIDEMVPTELASDAARIRQIMAELLDNAIKFTERGSIRLSAKLRVVTPENGKAGDSILDLAVTDTGIGIPSEQQKIIFQAFSQTDCGADRRRGGAGLGLAVTQKVVERLNGQIELVSASGRGSTFTVHLPARQVSGADH